MNERPTSLEEITREAIRVLTREIGVANTIRFLSQFDTGLGNYTEEREALLGDLTLDGILSAVRGGSATKQD